MDITLLEDALGNISRVFHKEADFQQALCWELHKQFPSLTIRAEYPVEGVNVDLWLVNDDARMALELKYPKKPFRAEAEHETFAFGDDPTDLACFDYLADIERIEGLIEKGACECGAALILSNNSNLWDNAPAGNNYDDFLLFDGRSIPREMEWAEGASVSASRNRPIKLTGAYTMRWFDYSYQYPKQPSGNTEFKYCMSEIHS